MRKLTTEYFIARSKVVHDGKYRYNKARYKTSQDKVIITCNVHGDFLQKANLHLQGRGCRECGLESNSARFKKTTEQFVYDAMSKHGDRYSYLKTKYKGNKSKVTITCAKHGDFDQIALNHIRGQGCPLCSNETRSDRAKSNTSDFIHKAKKIHHSKYDYSKTKYVNAKRKITITCNTHGDFRQSPNDHLSGYGCTKCGYESENIGGKLSNEEFINRSLKIHGDKYAYDLNNYRDTHKKVIITCADHGDFEQTPHSHMQGHGCPGCKNKTESRVLAKLNLLMVTKSQFKIKNRRYDFYVSEYKLLIERDGEQHYRDVNFGTYTSEVKKQHAIDIEKTNLAKKHGYKIARIPYWLTEQEEDIEIQNILCGSPTYPDIPDLRHEVTKPSPKTKLMEVA